MSLNAAALRILADKGLSAADIVELAEAMEVRRDATAAERQQRLRDRRKAERDGVTRDVTRDEVTADPSPQSPPLKAPPDPLKITPPLTPQPALVVGRAIPKFDPPEGVTPEQFKAFRQQRRKPLNERSYALLCRKLGNLAEAGWPPGEMIDLAIERGWETVFEPKDRRNGSHREPPAKPPVYRDPILGDAFEEHRAGMA